MKILEGLPEPDSHLCHAGSAISRRGAGAALQQGSVTVLLPPTPHTNPLCG